MPLMKKAISSVEIFESYLDTKKFQIDPKKDGCHPIATYIGTIQGKAFRYIEVK